MDSDETLHHLRTRIRHLTDQARRIVSDAETEKRAVTEVERLRLEAIIAEVEKTKARIAEIEYAEYISSKMFKQFGCPECGAAEGTEHVSDCARKEAEIVYQEAVTREKTLQFARNYGAGPEMFRKFGVDMASAGLALQDFKDALEGLKF